MQIEYSVFIRYKKRRIEFKISNKREKNKMKKKLLFSYASHQYFNKILKSNTIIKFYSRLEFLY
jgi:hypothetical protein